MAFTGLRMSREREARERLDSALVARGLVRSRASGRDLVRRGFVLVDDVVELKASRAVLPVHNIRLRADAPQYVSRGAEKLVEALAHFQYACADRRILDIGASTGGFTEVLLQRGAGEVFSIDVGRGQLNATLREHPRVHNLDGTDARRVSGDAVGAPVDALVCDVSFISLAKALEHVLMLVRRGGWMIALIKPQFEAGPDDVGSDGIVRNENVHQRVVDDVTHWLTTQAGWRVEGVIASPIAGGSGNKEFLIGALRDA